MIGLLTNVDVLRRKVMYRYERWPRLRAIVHCFWNMSFEPGHHDLGCL